MVWSQLILPGMVSSFMRLPVEGLYCRIFPVRHLAGGVELKEDDCLVWG